MYVCERRLEGKRIDGVRYFRLLLFQLFYKYKESKLLLIKFVKKILYGNTCFSAVIFGNFPPLSFYVKIA